MAVSIGLLSVVALASIPCDGFDIPDDTKIELLEFLDGATLTASVKNRTVRIRIRPLAGRDELRLEFENGRISSSAYRLFCANQALSRNYLRSLLYGAEYVVVEKVKWVGQNEIDAQVLFSASSMLIDVATCSVSDGFGVPIQSSVVEQTESLLDGESVTAVKYLRSAMELKKGLWADGQPCRPGVVSRPLRQGTDKECAIPLRSLTVMADVGGRWSRLESAPVVGITVICADSTSIDTVARKSNWVVDRLYNYVASMDIEEMLAPTFPAEIERQMLSILKTELPGAPGVEIMDVNVRYLRIRSVPKNNVSTAEEDGD